MAGGTQVRQMLMEMTSVSFVWKMTYKWRHVRRHVPSSLLQHLWSFRKPHSVKTPEGGREDAAAQVTGCRRPNQAAQKVNSDEVTAVPKEETATSGHQG